MSSTCLNTIINLSIDWQVALLFYPRPIMSKTSEPSLFADGRLIRTVVIQNSEVTWIASIKKTLSKISILKKEIVQNASILSISKNRTLSAHARIDHVSLTLQHFSIVEIVWFCPHLKCDSKCWIKMIFIMKSWQGIVKTEPKCSMHCTRKRRVYEALKSGITVSSIEKFVFASCRLA